MRYRTYEMAFPCPPVAAPGHDGFLITRPSRSRYDETIHLGIRLMTIFKITIFEITVCYDCFDFYVVLYIMFTPVYDL